MAKVKANNTNKKVRPALTPEAEENQCISLAIELVKQRLIDGTASSQETTHFLRLGSTEARLKKEILVKQKDLISAKTEEIESRKRIEELYANAVKAMKNYNGYSEDEGDDNEY